MYIIQQTALLGQRQTHNVKDTLQTHCDSSGFLKTKVDKSVWSLKPK